MVMSNLQYAQQRYDEKTPDDYISAAETEEFRDWAKLAVLDLRSGMDVVIETMRERFVIYASALTEIIQAELIKFIQNDEECWLAQMFQAAETEDTELARRCAEKLEMYREITKVAALELLSPHAEMVLRMLAEQNMENAA